MYFCYFIIISPWTKAWPFICTNWTPFTQGWRVPSLVLEEKKFGFRQCIFAISRLSGLEKEGGFIWTNLNPLDARMLSASLVEIRLRWAKIQEKAWRGRKIGLPPCSRWICYFNFAYIIYTALLSIKFKQCIIWSLSIYIIYIILYNYIVKIYLPSNIRFNLTNQDNVNSWDRRYYLNICADLLKHLTKKV